MKRFATFTLIFLLSMSSQLMAMDFVPETTEPTTSVEKSPKPDSYGEQDSYGGQEYGVLPDTSVLNSGFQSEDNDSSSQGTFHTSGGPQDQTQPEGFVPVASNQGTSSSIGVGGFSSGPSAAYINRGLDLQGLNEAQNSFNQARQTADEHQEQYRSMMGQTEDGNQSSNNTSLQLTSDEIDELEPKMKRKIASAQSALDKAKGAVNVVGQTSDGLQQQIDEANANIDQLKNRYKNQTGNASRRAAQYKVDETIANLRGEVRSAESQRDRLKVRAREIKKLENNLNKAKSAYEKLLKKVRAEGKEKQEAKRQALLAQTKEKADDLEQVAKEKQLVYEGLLRQVQEKASQIRAEQEALREELAQQSFNASTKASKLREQQENAQLQAEYQEKINAADKALQEAEKSARDASTQRQKEEDERVVAEEQAKLEQLRSDWREAKRRMKERKNARVKGLTKQWLENVREQVSQRQARESLREELAQQAFNAAIKASELREQRENVQLEKEYQDKIKMTEEALQEAEQSARDASTQRQQEETKRVVAEEQEKLEQERAEEQKALEQAEREKARLAEEQAKIDAETEITNLQEVQIIAKPALQFMPIISLPESIQEKVEIRPLISAAKTQRTLVKSYLGIQTVFGQQVLAAQVIVANPLAGGQATPAQIAQLSASVQTLTAQGQQIAQEQQQAKRDIGTLQSLNQKVIQKLDEQIAKLKEGEQTDNVQESIAQIKGYQQELAAEQKQLAAYLETLEGQTSRNQEVIDFYSNALEKIKEEQVEDATVEKDIKIIPSELEAGKKALDKGYDSEEPEDEGSEEVVEDLDDSEEEKECASGISKVMNLERELKSILNELRQLQEMVLKDAHQLDTKIQQAVESIVGGQQDETLYGSEDMIELIAIGKKQSRTGQVLTVRQKQSAALPFNKNGMYLARLDKELNNIEGDIKALEEDEPQTSDKPICQTLARMLNELAKQVQNAQKTLKNIREQNAFNLSLIKST